MQQADPRRIPAPAAASSLSLAALLTALLCGHPMEANSQARQGNAAAAAPPPRVATDRMGGKAAKGGPRQPAWMCDFEQTLCGMVEQSGREGFGERRSAFVSRSRSGKSAIRLHTEPGDSHVHGSGHWERNDLAKPPDKSYCNQGQEEWWGHSILFPDDFVFPPGPEAGAVFDFHHDASRGQANFAIQTVPGMGLRLRGYGGPRVDEDRYESVIADPYGAGAGVTRNQWYDFNYHVKWSDGDDGFFIAWLNGRKVLSHRGATLYKGTACYLKLANYHAPFDRPSSVIHDRVVRGDSPGEVSLWPLEQ
jgi:hypothetical protein